MECGKETEKVVEARAPGKVIISGEHAVVHGTAAVAAALDRYTIAKIRSNGEDGVLSLDLPDMKLHLKWPMHYIKNNLDFPITDEGSPVPNQMENIKAAIEFFINREMPLSADKGASAGVAAFLFLYISILGLQPLELTVTSELPAGAGLGSSAAFCVAVAGALLTLSGKLELRKHDVKSDWLDIEDKGRDLVNMWAFEGEKIIHGRPSGVDNTVSCYGHVVRFKKGNLIRLENPMNLRMLITNTKVSRNTKALVSGVANRADRHPIAMASVFKAVDAICEEFVAILDLPSSQDKEELEDSLNGDAMESFAETMANGLDLTTTKVCGSRTHAPISPGSKGVEDFKRLEELIEMNQGLLQCMGVSHPSIAAICQTTSRFNMKSKLTGAGGGGCVVTLLANEASNDTIQKLKAQLEMSGYECFEAGIGGTGLQIGYHNLS